MKTAEEIFNTIAFLDKNGDFFNMRRKHIIEAMKEYAKQVAEQALKDAGRNARMKLTNKGETEALRLVMSCTKHGVYEINEQSILQTEIKLP